MSKKMSEYSSIQKQNLFNYENFMTYIMKNYNIWVFYLLLLWINSLESMYDKIKLVCLKVNIQSYHNLLYCWMRLKRKTLFEAVFRKLLILYDERQTIRNIIFKAFNSVFYSKYWHNNHYFNEQLWIKNHD